MVEFPLRFEPAEAFPLVREFLSASGFHEAALCTEFGVEQLSSVLDDLAERPVPAGLLARLFLRGVEVPAAEFRDTVSDAAGHALEQLGLIARNGDFIWSPVLLYPVEDLLFASDRLFSLGPDGAVCDDPEFVYPALTSNTLHFLEMLPRGKSNGSLLDLGAGCGAAAVLSARHFQSTCAADISARACAFSRFNAQLNQCENVEVVCGDLYEPVQDRQFDCIVTHPPYVPTTGSGPVFSDGGSDGEQVTRGAIAGAARHLLPGGRFYCLAMIADHQEIGVEDRVRGWLGEGNDEFDLLLVVREADTPTEYAARLLIRGREMLETSRAVRTSLEQHGVAQLIYGHLAIARHLHPAPAFTGRRLLGKRCTAHDIEWAFRWQNASAEELLSALFKPAEGAEMHVRHEVRKGRLTPRDYRFQTSEPFTVDLRCRAWMAYLVSQMAGAGRVGDWVQDLTGKGVSEEQIVQGVRVLIEAGVLVPAGEESIKARKPLV